MLANDWDGEYRLELPHRFLLCSLVVADLPKCGMRTRLGRGLKGDGDQ